MSPEIPDGSVVITPEQMYRETHERYGKIEAALGSLRSDVHGLPAQVAEHDTYLNTLRSAGLPARFEQLEKDVGVLKGRWAWAIGAGSAACFAASLLGSYLAILFH